MRRCVKCGAYQKDDSRYCKICGSPCVLNARNQNKATQNCGNDAPQYVQPAAENFEKSKDKLTLDTIKAFSIENQRKLVILGVVLTAIIVLIIVIKAIAGSGSKKSRVVKNTVVHEATTQPYNNDYNNPDYYISEEGDAPIPVETEATTKEASSKVFMKEAETLTGSEKLEQTTAGPVTIDSYISTWWGTERWRWTIEKIDDDSVMVYYSGSGSASDYGEGKGIGYFDGTSLHVQMEYIDHYGAYDEQGNIIEETRSSGLVEDTVTLVSTLSKVHSCSNQEYVLTDDYLMNQSNGSYNAYDYMDTAHCDSPEHFVIWNSPYFNVTTEEENYILPMSSYAFVTEADIFGMDANTLKLARNEIYARYGRKFKDDALQSYFNGCDWYYGYIEPEEFDNEILNEYEKENVKFLKEHEETRESSQANLEYSSAFLNSELIDCGDHYEADAHVWLGDLQANLPADAYHDTTISISKNCRVYWYTWEEGETEVDLDWWMENGTYSMFNIKRNSNGYIISFTDSDEI